MEGVFTFKPMHPVLGLTHEMLEGMGVITTPTAAYHIGGG